MRMTSKGQVTIPQAIREQLGLRPGVELDFTVDGDEIRVRRVASSGSRTVDALIAARPHLRPEFRDMSTDDWMRFLRGDD